MPFITVPAVAAEDTFVVPCFVANDATDDWGSQLSASPVRLCHCVRTGREVGERCGPAVCDGLVRLPAGPPEMAKFQVLAAVRPSSTFTTVSAPTSGAGMMAPVWIPTDLSRCRAACAGFPRKVRCTTAIADRKSRVGIVSVGAARCPPQRM